MAKRNDWEIVETIAIKESTRRKANENREGIKRLLEIAHSGRIKKVLVWHVSRVGRTNLENHKLLNELNELGISIYCHNLHMETILPNGKKNPIATILFLIFGEMAEQDNEDRRDAIISGQKQSMLAGTKFGRKVGTTYNDEKLLKIHAPVARKLKEGHSIRDTAKLCDVAKSTVQRVKEAMTRLNPR